MNRPFPRLVLKIERGGMMPGTRIPTGSNRTIYWEYLESEVAAVVRVKDLLESCTSYDIVRITSICVYPDGRAIKITSYTPGEHPWHFAHWTAQQCKFKSLRSLGAAFAILPKEVLDEAAR